VINDKHETFSSQLPLYIDTSHHNSYCELAPFILVDFDSENTPSSTCTCHAFTFLPLAHSNSQPPMYAYSDPPYQTPSSLSKRTNHSTNSNHECCAMNHYSKTAYPNSAPNSKSKSTSFTTHDKIAHPTAHTDDPATINDDCAPPMQLWLQEPAQGSPWHGMSSYQPFPITLTPLPACTAKWEDIRVRSTGEVGDNMDERSNANKHAPKLMKPIITDERACAAEVSYMER
jgi:hypothetical protein